MEKQTIFVYGTTHHNGAELNGVTPKDLEKLQKLLIKYGGHAKTEQEVLKGYQKNSDVSSEKKNSSFFGILKKIVSRVRGK